MIQNLIKTIDFKQGTKCKSYQEIKNSDESNILKALKNAEYYCIKNNYPPTEILEKYADKCKGFFYKKTGRTNEEDIAIFDSNLHLEYKGYAVADVFVRDSKITIEAKDYAIVFVTATGQCTVNATGNVTVYSYSLQNEITGAKIIHEWNS